MQVPGAHRARRQGPEMGMLLSDLGLRVQGFGVSGFIFYMGLKFKGFIGCRSCAQTLSFEAWESPALRSDGPW